MAAFTFSMFCGLQMALIVRLDRASKASDERNEPTPYDSPSFCRTRSPSREDRDPPPNT